MAKRRFRSRRRFTRVRRRRGGARRLRRFVKRVVRRMSEVKYRTATSSVAFDAASNYQATIVPTFPQGVDKYNRIGNRIRYKYLQFRWTLQASNGSNNLSRSQCFVRLLLIQSRTVPPAVANPLNQGWLFDSPGPTAIVSSIQNQNVRVLMDKSIWLGILDNATLIERPPNIWGKKKVRINNNVNFINSTDLLPTDPKDNYYLYIISNRTTQNDVTLNLVWHSRISFIDL